MKRTLPILLTLTLLLSILLPLSIASAQIESPPDDQSAEVDDAAPVNRVARLSFVDGDVSFLRAGVTEWAPAVENLPLLAGDQIYTGAGARAEIQLARGNYIRLSQGTELTITDLSDTSAQVEITEGIAIIRIERLASVFQRFEVDTPNTAVLVQQDGLYRVEVRGEKNSELSVRRGEAEVSTEEGSFKVREGHKLLVDTTNAGRLELALDDSRDDWDQWSYDRDTTIARTSVDAAPDYVAGYETANNDFYGVSDLSSYGTWTNYSSYGQCWIPRVGSDWAPYRTGQWLWIPAAGWTWLSSEPWGWAPYHYGRWSYISGLGWAWIPGFGSGYRGYGYRDYRWRPALVYFFNSPTPRGNYVGWYPLAPGERWRRHDNRRGNDHAHLRYPREGWRRPDDGRVGNRPSQGRRGMTILPAEGFGRASRSAVRPGAPTGELSDLISKGARSGLPDIKPSPIAASPELAENDIRRSRRIAVPSNEIIKRSVVTRNPKVDSTAGTAVARERRIISPRKVESGPILREPGSERGFDRRPKPGRSADSQGAPDNAGRESQKGRVSLPSPSEKGDGDTSDRERRRNRDGDSSGNNTGSNPGAGNNAAKEERRRARQEQLQTPKPRESYQPTETQRDSETRSKERRPPETAPQPRDDGQRRNRAEEPAKSHERPAPPPRVEPKQERPSERPAPAPRVEPKQERPSERPPAPKAEPKQERPPSENQAKPDRQQQKEHRQERQEQRKRP